ncbi:YihY/virulence factor BrkB family protein [Persicimonas caeni]|nr:YihY/virulence factor BrkB family protein [Persicimonas caeni]
MNLHNHPEGANDAEHPVRIELDTEHLPFTLFTVLCPNSLHCLLMTNRQRLKTAWTILRETFEAYTRDNAARLAASIAFYAIFSVAPILIIATAIAGFIFGDDVALAEIAADLDRFVSPETSEYVFTLVERWQDTTSGVLATVIGFGTLFWGAYRLFLALQDTLNMIWNVRPRSNIGIKGWIRMRLLPFVMVIVIGLLLLASMVVTAALAALGRFFGEFFPVPTILADFSNFVVWFALLTGLFAAIFKILPDVTIQWRDVWIGAALTSFLFSIGRTLIGLYLAHTSTTSIFGAAGSLVALLFWVYFSAQIFFWGAEFTQVWARHLGDRIEPEPDAVHVERNSRQDRAAAKS